MFKKTDLIYSLILGEIVGLLTFITFKNVGIDVDISNILKSYLGFEINLGFLLALFVPIAAAIAIYITYLLGKKYASIFQFGKFLAVGVTNTLIDLGVLNFLIFATTIASGVFYSIFNVISFTIAVINSFIWNKYWTFKENGKKKTKKEFIQFLIVSLIGLVINVGIASLIVNLIGPKLGLSDEIWANIGKLSAIFFSMVWNFVGYKFIVFKE